jgi:hypothetical protein
MKQANQAARRRALFHEAIEWAEVSVLKARAKGAMDPVVFMLDPQDDYAWALIEPAADAPRVVEFWEEAARRGKMSYVTEGLPKRVAVELLVGVGLSAVAEAIMGPAPAGGYWAIVVAAGGAEVFPMPDLP